MENPVLNDDTAGAALRAMGAQMDATSDEPSSTNDQPETRAAGTEETTAKNTPADPKSEGEHSDNPEKKPDDQAQKEKQEPPAKEPSAYEKAKQREAIAWKKINDEKAALQRERDEINRQRQQPQRAPEKAGPTKDANDYSADDYEAAAKQFDKEGDDDMAKKARQQAAGLRQKDAEGQQVAQKQRFENDWRSDMNRTIGANPDLAKPDTADAKELSQLLTEEPIFGHIPNGFSKAVQLLQLRRQAGQVIGFKERAEKAEKEVERLTKLTQINGGGPSAPPAGQKSFDDMSEKEQRSYLEREAARTDATYGG